MDRTSSRSAAGDSGSPHPVQDGRRLDPAISLDEDVSNCRDELLGGLAWLGGLRLLGAGDADETEEGDERRE